ncbi:hypothetical protein Tco_0723234 [Tanacetum coccineum]
MQMRIMRDVKIQEEVRREVLSFLEIDWLAGHQEAMMHANINQQRLQPALSIENGSLFEGESEFEKLKICLITLVSIRSDWEDLPWLFRSVENLNTMAEQNVPAQAPTRTDEQIALDITPVDPAHPFELPSTGDTVIDFLNHLRYPEPVEFVSNIRVNYVYQPRRAILTLINQCLTGKTSGIAKPRHPVLQMLWGIVTRTNVDRAELLWEEFTQGIQTFFSHKASHKASLRKS